MFAVFGAEGGLEKKSPNTWGAIFDVEDPRPRVPLSKGKFLDVNQALEVARFDIQYLDWRARQDLLTIMLLHDKVLMSLVYIFFVSTAGFSSFSLGGVCVCIIFQFYSLVLFF